MKSKGEMGPQPSGPVPRWTNEGLRAQHLPGVCNALFRFNFYLVYNPGHCVDQDGLNLTERFSRLCLPSAPPQPESPSFNPQ